MLGPKRTRITLFALLIVAASAMGSTAAAQADRDALVAKYESKKKKEFATAAPWQYSLEAAKKLSKSKGLPIIAYFTRSYAP